MDEKRQVKGRGPYYMDGSGLFSCICCYCGMVWRDRSMDEIDRVFEGHLLTVHPDRSEVIFDNFERTVPLLTVNWSSYDKDRS